MPSQLERSSATREKTIAATIDCVVEFGYTGATIAAIAQRAGLSRGAVSHQYPDKFSLVVAVVDEVCRRHTERTLELLVDAPHGRARIEAGLDELWRAFKGRSYIAALEFYAACRTDDGLRPRIVGFEADMSEVLRTVVRGVVGPTSDPELLDLRADVVINTLRGLALLRTTGADPARIEQVWTQARNDAVDGFLQLTTR
jgi:AcrR family transcriptional regulator